MRRAFSLMEILVAVALIGMAVLTLLGVYLGGLGLVAQSRDHTAATDLARQVLEEIKELRWEQLPAADGTFDGRVPTARQGLFPPAPYPARGPFQLVVETANRGGLKIVTVRVLWGDRHEVSLATMLSRP